jgi:hypothetical protein
MQGSAWTADGFGSSTGSPVAWLPHRKTIVGTGGDGGSCLTGTNNRSLPRVVHEAFQVNQANENPAPDLGDVAR